MGIGRPPAGFSGDVAAFVLSAFSAAERPHVEALVEKGRQAVLQILTWGLDRAMRETNTKKEGN
jgi:PTH1 family peptidyl-tRNA hydrolase